MLLFVILRLRAATQAGGDGGQMVSVVPAGLTRLFQHPTLDWNLFSTNQHALTDREVGTGGHAGDGGGALLSTSQYPQMHAAATPATVTLTQPGLAAATTASHQHCPAAAVMQQ